MSRRLRVAAAITFLAALLLPVSAATAATFPGTINLPAGWRPEGITSQGTTFYVGSLANGAVLRGNVRTGVRDVFIPGAGQPAVGIDVDEANGRLWVAGGPSGEVRAYDIRTGAPLRTYTFAGSGFLNDLVVTNRAVYVTDSNNAVLRVVPLGSGGALLPPTAAFTLTMAGFPNVAGFNANGIVATRGWLIVVNSTTGQLFRVNPATGAATAIDTGGYSVGFGDGLELRGSTLYVVRNQLNLVAVLKLGPRLTSAHLQGEITSTNLDVPTTTTVAAGRLWTVNARFGTVPDPATASYWITQLPAKP